MYFRLSERNIKIIILILLSTLSFVAAITKVFVGLEIDEEFVIVQGYRLYNGDHMFLDMWEIYQTSSLFVFPFIWIWENLHQNSEYIILFLRIICTILHFGIAILLYHTLLKCNSKFYSFCLACIFFNFLPKWIINFEYENLLIICLTLTSILLYKINVGTNISIKRCRIYSVLAGICFSMAVLAYPTALISFPLYLVIIAIFLQNLKEKGKGNKRNLVIVWFCGACIFSAIIFFIFVFQNISIKEFIHTLPYLLRDSSHSFTGKILGFFKELPILFIRACVPGILAWLCTYVMERYCNGIGKGLFLFQWICLWNILFVVIIFVSNLLGRHSGSYGLQTRHLVLFFCNLYLIRHLKTNIKQTIFFLWMTGLFAYLSVLMATNLSLEVSASSLILGMLGTLLAICSWDTEGSRRVKILQCVTLVTLTIGIIFNKGFFVTIDGTGPASILETRVQVQTGPARGIWIYENEYLSYKNKANAIRSNTNNEDIMLYLSRHSLGNLFTKGRFTSVSSHGTTIYDKQWVSYWDDFNHQLPTVVVIDSDKINDLDIFLKESPFGIWVAKNYKVEDAIFEGGLWFIRL